MKIYFAGAIRGGRQKLNDYIQIVNTLEKYGEVLTKHIIDPKLTNKGENGITATQIYERDLEWLKQSDVVIAEVSIPSLGIGYEIGIAETLNKKIICLYEDNVNNATLSAMIGGNKKLTVYKYENIEALLQILRLELSNIK